MATREMATRAPFLTETYGGYQHRDIPAEDAEITRVGPGTPCGEWMRRYWVPVAHEQDLGGACPRRFAYWART